MGFKNFTDKLFPKPIEVEENYEPIYDDVNSDGRDAGVIAQDNYAPARSGVNVVMGGAATGSSIEMKVVTPKSYDTVTQIADLLLSKKTVLLNLENTNRETARRLIDFLSGAAYALGGGVQKVADNTYAITPSNVAVSRENVGVAQPQQQVAPEAEENNTVAF